MTASRDEPRPRALTIAGSDSGGGAGIQADLKTFSALGVYGMTAITAITVQNTKGVYGYEAMSPQLVDEQIRAVTTDIGVDAAKTGMLANAGIVRAVASAVAELAIPHLVVDPVFVSKHGHLLLADDAVVELRSTDPPARHARDAEPARGERPGRRRGGGEGRHAPGRRRDPRARRGSGAGEGRPSRGVDRGRGPVRVRRDRGMARRRADRHAEHPRDRMHAVGGDHGPSGDGVGAARRGARGEGVRDRGDPRARWRSARGSGPWISCGRCRRGTAR